MRIIPKFISVRVRSKSNLTLFFLFCFSLITSSGLVKGQTAYEITRSMFAETKKISTLKYSMKKTERFEGKMLEQVSTCKLNLQPFKVYCKQESPKEGVEMLYSEGLYSNKALINPNGFPWFTIKLSPMGEVMRNSQHHTLLNSGYDHLISILEFLLDKYGEEAKTMVRELESVTHHGRECYAIELNNPYFKYINYTLKKGETLLSIVEKYKLSEHMILEKNEAVDDYDDVKEGETIQIPNDYSPRMLIYIDKVRLIPLMMKIYDDQGLYELYEYYDVGVNPHFHTDEFSPGYPDYGF